MPKNLSGGKAHKKHGGKEPRSSKHNREMGGAVISDVISGTLDDNVFICRVTRVLGDGRFEVITSSGAAIPKVSIRGVLSVRGKAARAAGNPVAISLDTYVVVHCEKHGSQIIAVLSRKQVREVRGKIPTTKTFFADSMVAAGDDECGFDFEDDEEADESDAEEDRSKRASARSTAAAAAVREAAAAAEDEVDIDAI
jgi:hypothetical protein